MDRHAERKHRKELKRAEKRSLIRRLKGYAEHKIGKYGSKCVHHHGSPQKEAPAVAAPPVEVAPTEVVKDAQ